MEDIRAVLALPGVTGRKLALALGIPDSRVSEWKSGRVQNTTLTHDELARAVAQVTGAAPPQTDSPLSYVVELLARFEADAQRSLATIREARAALGLGAATLPDVVARERESRADLDAVRPAAAAPARRRRGG